MQCTSDADCGWNAHCVECLCTAFHFGQNLPADVMMIVGSFCVAGVSLAAGVGGGGLFVPMGMMILSLDSRVATALSQSMLVGGSVAAFAYNVTHHHPKNPSRPLVDFELACLLGPALMAGAQIGSMAHMTAPPALILFLLVVVLLDAAKKGIASAQKIASNFKATHPPPEARETQKVMMEEHHTVAEGESAEAPLSSSESSTSVSEDEAHDRIREAQRNLVVLWIFCIIMDLLKGWLVQICSPMWWVLITVCVVGLGGFAFYYANELSGREPMDEASLDFRDLAFTLLRWSMFAGVLAALCGIGGGMVMGPILVGLNVPPPVAAATTATTLLVLSTSIDAVYLVRGQAPMHFAAYLCLATATGALVGKVLIGRWVKATGKDYVIVWCLAGITIVSVLVMGTLGLRNTWQNGYRAFEFNNMCKVAETVHCMLAGTNDTQVTNLTSQLLL